MLTKRQIYYQNNKEQIKGNAAQWNKNNKEKRVIIQNKYNAKNRTKSIEFKRKYNKKNKVKINKKGRTRYKMNKYKQIILELIETAGRSYGMKFEDLINRPNNQINNKIMFKYCLIYFIKTKFPEYRNKKLAKLFGYSDHSTISIIMNPDVTLFRIKNPYNYPGYKFCYEHIEWNFYKANTKNEYPKQLKVI